MHHCSIVSSIHFVYVGLFLALKNFPLTKFALISLGVTWPFLLCYPQNCHWCERSGRVWKCFLWPMLNEYWLLIPLKPLILVYKAGSALIQQFCERIFQQLPWEGSLSCMQMRLILMGIIRNRFCSSELLKDAEHAHSKQKCYLFLIIPWPEGKIKISDR